MYPNPSKLKSFLVTRGTNGSLPLLNYKVLLRPHHLSSLRGLLMSIGQPANPCDALLGAICSDWSRGKSPSQTSASLWFSCQKPKSNIEH